MSKKSKTLIVTLGTLALLAGVYYGITAHSGNRDNALRAAPESMHTLGNLASSDIVKIETQDVTLQRQGEMWELIFLNGEDPPRRLELDQDMVRILAVALATVWAERVADESPQDISVFGLDVPASQTAVTDSHGNTVVYLVGDMTPSRTSYFVMEQGNPAVFVVDAFSVNLLRFAVDDIRNRALFPSLPFQALSRMRLESAQTLIDISPIPEPPPLHLAFTFSRFAMTSPYNLLRGVESQAFQNLLAPLNNLRIEEFVNDAPLSLSPYGLDNPVRLLLEFGGADGGLSIDLLIGNQTGGVRYAKLADAPGVFTVGGLEPLVSHTPLALADRFPLLIGIGAVTGLSVSGGESVISADIQGEGRDMILRLNGRRAEERSFRNWFQSAIGLRIDAEMPAGGFIPEAGAESITIEYHLKNPPGERVSITLIPFNRDFYALYQEGTIEFLIARNQVHRIFQTAVMVVFLE